MSETEYETALARVAEAWEEVALCAISIAEHIVADHPGLAKERVTEYVAARAVLKQARIDRDAAFARKADES